MKGGVDLSEKNENILTRIRGTCRLLGYKNLQSSLPLHAGQAKDSPHLQYKEEIPLLHLIATHFLHDR